MDAVRANPNVHLLLKRADSKCLQQTNICKVSNYFEGTIQFVFVEREIVFA